MAKYIDKKLFLSSMGLVGDETKYGNRDSEHSSRSYSTWMGYEIMNSVDDSEDEDAVHVVRCKDCKHHKLPAVLTQKYGAPGTLTCHNWHSPCNKRNVKEEDFCSYGERRIE